MQEGEEYIIKREPLLTRYRVCFQVDNLKNDPYLVLSYSESPFFAGRDPDAINDRLARDLPLNFLIKHNGTNCVAPGYNRGAFKYLTVYMLQNDTAADGGFWHEGHYLSRKVGSGDESPSWMEVAGQKVLGWQNSKNEGSSIPGVAISAVWVSCTSFPSNPYGRAYTGYFDSSSTLLNRIWYAGAYTLQLSTLDPREGGALISYNRNYDHNEAPEGAWYSNFTIANGSTVTTDGAKRDRMVWPGDMTIAVPGIAVSTYDMLAVRNALNAIYDHQYSDGSMPYAGPPLGFFGEFSDTYHLHTLVGSYIYVLYSGDLKWLEERWPAYLRALKVSIEKVDEFNLLHVSSIFDWIRPGMTGHNVEASALLFEVLSNSVKLATWLGEGSSSNIKLWESTRARLGKGIETLYCEQDGLYSDNKGRRGCHGDEKVLPQDGNSWVLLSQAFSSDKVAFNVSQNLRSRWTKFGAPAVEFPNVISPFASSFELLGHIAAKNPNAAVELMELMWGYMLDGPGMTNSTLLEGYRTDGYIHYPAYWSDARNSHAHGWATGPTTVLMQGVLGIILTSPLGKTWSIEPHLTKWLSYARGGFATKLGKFEVAISLMRSFSTGRKVEVLEATVPENTSGVLNWGGKEQTLGLVPGDCGTFKFFRYTDVVAEDEGQVWSFEGKELDFVPDDTWVRPVPEERPEGMVDWEALEANYGLAEQRFALLRSESLYTASRGDIMKGEDVESITSRLKADDKVLEKAVEDFAERVRDMEERLQGEQILGLRL